MSLDILGGHKAWFVKKENIGLILGPLLFIAIILIPAPQSMAKAASDKSLPAFAPQLALGTMIWMVVWWVTECAPLGITGLIAPLVFVISGILTIQNAVQNFADPIIWIFIAGFVLAAAFQRSGLDTRIAYSLALLYRGSNPRIATFFVACLPVFLLTMTGSITASTTIVFPFLVAFMNILNIPVRSNDGRNKGGTDDDNDAVDASLTSGSLPSSRGEYKQQKRSNYAEASFLSLGQAASAGAMLLLISTAPNLIAKATVEEFVSAEGGQTISFTDWFVIGTPHAIMGLLVSWFIIFLMIKPEIKSLPATRSQFKARLKSMGKMQRQEKAVLAILIAAMFLWTVPSLLRSSSEASASLAGDSGSVFSNLVAAFAKNMTEAVPALMIIVAVALVRVGRNRPPLLKWEEMTKAVDWNIVLLFGGGLALGMGIEASGLADWIGLQLSSSSLIAGDPAAAAANNNVPWIVFAISAIMAFAISYAASNTASAVITCPIAATLAIGAGVNPVPPIIAAGLACSISTAIPSTTPPMAIIYSSRAVRISGMLKTGIVSDFVRLVLLILLGPPLISLVTR
ncbi:di-/tricarboxylate transporter [Candidatus Nitrososphaera evergladensis SR1]|uniref:Di-/tricarboxylate transporter n=1 Tax=Candidatus Nitrososphaera evergladensis SR1 TaxID=1459636 RepID=A0A075MV08_9ARCH|nr:SLC13 family permease [Candidatus Nitrososphaera evergladensis]AIF85491.1 di-/tricarboxylate transporter [Candidatus Nitrososphaera evergladensis SR1]